MISVKEGILVVKGEPGVRESRDKNEFGYLDHVGGNCPPLQR